MLDNVAATPPPEGFLEDAQGRLVRREQVKPEHLLEDELVREIVAESLRLSAELLAFRQRSFEQIRGILELLAQKHGAPKGGPKGNVQLQSYDGRLRVQVAVGDTLSFGPELQVAKTLIDGCLTRWAEGANANLRTVVMDAFAVDQQGKINVDRVLSLRRLQIDDAQWKQAMEAISEAVRVVRSKEYLRVYRRESPTGMFLQVPLDVARA